MPLDVQTVTTALHAAARRGEALTYSDALGSCGLAFSRPKMRALCALLGDIDAGERGAGRPDLAVLVVRASDGLPGQGWWVAEAVLGDYAGPWAGGEATAYIRARQAAVFAFWAATDSPR
jgi:hypothetical protein